MTSYLAGEFPLEAIMLDNVILDLDVDPVIVIPKSPARHPGFGLVSFFVAQLFETFCHFIAPSGIGSSLFIEGVIIDAPCASRKHIRLLIPLQFEHFLCEIS